MRLPQYLPHTIYATALTSLSIHLLFQKKGAESERGRSHAQISLLETALAELRAGKSADDPEILKLRRLAQLNGHLGPTGTPQNSLSWMDVIMGRKRLGMEEIAEAEKWEEHDISKLRQEFDKSA